MYFYDYTPMCCGCCPDEKVPAFFTVNLGGRWTFVHLRYQAIYTV